MNTIDPQTYLAAIVASSDDAIISKDLNGNITSWNASAERIFGYTAAEAIGRHITLIIPPDRLAEEEGILTTLKDGRRVEHFETIRRHKDGHTLPVSLTVSPIRDASGAIIGASKISRDISERVAAERTIREMSQKKDEFLANMSHELRTPMNAVIGLANLLQASKTLSERDRKFVTTLKISADNLMDLINDLLDFAKIESDTMPLEHTEFNLFEQVEKIISVMNVKAREKNLTLSIHYPRPMQHHFLGDPLRVHQIIMNLVSNAIKFTEKGSVDVAIEMIDGQVSVKVSDTGIGIDKEKYDAIFEKFTQADSSISRRYGGSGLGLSIVRALVDKMGGSVRVTSDVGLGTAFTVLLPLTPTKGKLGGAPKNAVAPPGRKNVLLVEDYDANIMVATAMLEALGYDFDIANTGVEAMRMFMRGEYDVILMDVQMHELDGLAATQRIRQIEDEKKQPRTPIIAMTAHVREQDKLRCKEAGMDDFIPKPFEPAMLSEKLAQYIAAQEDNGGHVAGMGL